MKWRGSWGIRAFQNGRDLSGFEAVGAKKAGNHAFTWFSAFFDCCEAMPGDGELCM
jgi:hypothetical protein